MIKRTNNPIPAVLESCEVARLIGWDRRRMLRLLQQVDIASPVKTKEGTRWFVSRNDLRQKLPVAYKELKRRRVTGELPPLKKRPYTKKSIDNSVQPSAAISN